MCTDTGQAYMFPTSVKEVERLGWDFIDVILFSGDAFIDHPSSGTAMIARVLQREGYRVAVVPQPNWQDDLRDFRKLGAPRLFFGVNSGAMDSMVNHYTAARRLRSDDAYTPGGRAGHRPDYAVTVYTRILKRLYPHVPVVIGGIEASLRQACAAWPTTTTGRTGCFHQSWWTAGRTVSSTVWGSVRWWRSHVPWRQVRIWGGSRRRRILSRAGRSICRKAVYSFIHLSA